MQKKAILPFVVILCFFLMYRFEYLTLSDLDDKNELRRNYVNKLNQANALFYQKSDKENIPDRPDKGVLRDFLMTMDPSIGAVPVKQYTVVYDHLITQKLLLKKKNDSDTDFQWNQAPSNVAGRMRTFMEDPNVENKLWAGSVTGGLWVKDDYSDNSLRWKPVEGPWDNLSVSVITSDPNNTDVFYLGTGESYTAVSMYRESSGLGTGIWKSTDGGNNWEQLETSKNFAYINDIVIRNENGKSVVYVAVASGSYKGKEFDSSPSDGLFRSADDGSTWQQVLPAFVNGEAPAVSDIELTKDNRLFAGTMRNKNQEGGANLLYSDNGLDWQFTRTEEDNFRFIDVGGRVLTCSSPSDPKRIYTFRMATEKTGVQALEQNIYRDRVLKLEQSYDGGLNWSEIPLPTERRFSNIPWHALSFAVHPQNPNHIVIGALNLFSMDNTNEIGSELGNPKWRLHAFWSADNQINEDPQYEDLYVHADMHQIEFMDSEGKEMVIATDAGFYRTIDFDKSPNSISEERTNVNFAGPSFRHINYGLNTLQYYSAAIHPTSSDLLGGLQDNGTLLFDGKLIEPDNKVSGGDGTNAFYDPDDEVSITSIYHNAYYCFNASGKEIGSIFSMFPSGNFINASVYDAKINHIYANGYLISGSNGEEYSLKDNLIVIDISPIITGRNTEGKAFKYSNLTQAETPYSAMKLSPFSASESSTIILGTQAGRIFKVTGLPGPNVNSTELNTSELPVGFISSIDIGLDEDHILVTFTNYNTQSVWLTRNGGTTWENVERNLPDLPVRWGIFNQNNKEHILLATEDGVWHNAAIDDGDEEWKQIAGLPDIRVDMIKQRRSDNKLVAATHGRGMFYGIIPDSFNSEDQVLNADDEKFASNYSIYPNPVSDQINISLQNLSDSELKIDLYDINGKLVRKLFKGSVSRDFEGQYPVDYLESGIYVIVFQNNTSQKSFRIVKE